ncbi:MAG: GAF domain-containing protein [Magnetococcales bacterium]|nr:GAF domain-containing protein [Magnetococcales bacterium]
MRTLKSIQVFSDGLGFSSIGSQTDQLTKLVLYVYLVRSHYKVEMIDIKDSYKPGNSSKPAYLMADLSAYYDQLDQIKHLNNQLVSTDDCLRLLDFMVNLTPRVFGIERCNIFILDTINQRLWLQSGTGMHEAEIDVPLNGTIAGRTMTTDQIIWVQSRNELPYPNEYKDSQLQDKIDSLLSIPIKSASLGLTVGAIQLINKNGGKPFTSEDLKLTEQMIPHFKAAILKLFNGQRHRDMIDNSHESDKRLRRFQNWLSSFF